MSEGKRYAGNIDDFRRLGGSGTTVTADEKRIAELEAWVRYLMPADDVRGNECRHQWEAKRLLIGEDDE